MAIRIWVKVTGGSALFQQAQDEGNLHPKHELDPLGGIDRSRA